MNVAYVFSTPNASYILEKMIVPQLEEERHGVTVVGMFFFVDNNYLLVKGNPTGERLGEAFQDGRIVRLGLWLDSAGGIRRARWKATTCAALMAYAEIACRLLEQGHDPTTLDEPLSAAIVGVHPGHRARAALAPERSPPP